MTANYLVCATPRSGSSLLCEALAATGVAGWPFEYFQEPVRRKCCADWGIPPPAEPADYLRLLSARTRTGNGVFGAKVMYGNLAAVLAPATSSLLPGLKYIRIIRRDALRQAVSNLRASQTDHWSHAQAEDSPPKMPPRYDFALIEERLARIQRQNAKWDRFFADFATRPAVVYYEDLAANLSDGVRAVLRHLEIEAPEPLFSAPLTLRRQGDALNEEWLERYRADKTGR